MIHFKRNTHPHGARGVSDLYPVMNLVERLYKLARNLGEGATIQSAIAMIIKRMGSSQTMSLDDLTQNAIDLHRAIYKANGYTTGVQKFEAGSVITTDNNSDYESGPVSQGAMGFIEIGQWLARLLGARWNMPEWIISGDASNNNYASGLVAQSPFVRYCEHEQRLHSLNIKTIYWKVLNIAYLQGAFTGYVNSWGELKKAITPVVTAPIVASNDEGLQTQRLSLLNERGILTRERWAEMENLPPEEVAEDRNPEELAEDLLSSL